MIPSMEYSKQQNAQFFHEEGDDDYEDDYSENGVFDSDMDCDSDTDPSYCIVEDTQRRLSDLSIKKKSKSRIGKQSDEGFDKVDEKSFEEIEKFIQAGGIEKLKVEQCKVYLRKNGLRLTGNKETLLRRIKEHQEILNVRRELKLKMATAGGIEKLKVEQCKVYLKKNGLRLTGNKETLLWILNGRGEVKYPVSSFVLNCKGDACTGDIVMFKQSVYKTYNIASRRASGPPLGTRIVVGRIVKESYGAAKQQHTFTIEVLWSKGKKPLPPLHLLLIKGRNLYRRKTLRQRWEDEGERQKVLQDKHSRGSLARSARESRIQDKEMRISLREKPLPPLHPLLIKGQNLYRLKTLRQRWEDEGERQKVLQDKHSRGSLARSARESRIQDKEMRISLREKKGLKKERSQSPPLVKPNQRIQTQHLYSSINSGKTGPQQFGLFMGSQNYGQNMNTAKQTTEAQQPANDRVRKDPDTACENGFAERRHHRPPLTSLNYSRPIVPPHRLGYKQTSENGFTERHHHRPPLTSMNYSRPVVPPNGQFPCKFYAQGMRCYYGDNCKFSHN